MFSRRASTHKVTCIITCHNSKVATEVCLVDVHYVFSRHYYIRSRDNSKVATEVCLVDVHYYIRSRDNSKVAT